MMWGGNRCSTAALATLILTASQAATAQLIAESTTALIQGEALDEIRAATRHLGGTITHELPIISAIGATIAPMQLQQLREMDFVERVIDDLDADEKSEPPRDCPITAALELHWNGRSLSWRLFNKADHALPLSKLLADWPEALGALQELRIGSKVLALQALPAASGAVNLELGEEMLQPGETTVNLSFEHAPTLPTPEMQNAMDLSVAYSGDCNVEAVPSYTAPLADSYYPGESGARLLHRHGVTGKGVTVAVLDSGLWEHPPAITHNSDGELRVLARYNAILGETVDKVNDESGHGTHMTSVLARSDRASPANSEDEPGFRGVAPDVSLVIVKAFDSSGTAQLLDLVRAVQWLVDNRERYDIRVVNMSFSMRPRWPYWDDPLNQALMRAWEAGLVLVAAAGNDGPDSMTIGSPGNLPYLITVGAVTDSWTPGDRDDDYIPDFSSRGPTPSGHIKPDLVTYGGHITGLIEPGTTLTAQLPEYMSANGELVMTGTSQATAVVSGLAALILQAEPTVDNNALKCMLTSAAEPAINVDGRLAYSPFLQGHGLASASRALAVGDRSCGNIGLELAKDIARTEHYYGPAIFKNSENPTLPGADKLISEVLPEKGTSVTRRWGAESHLRRLTAFPEDAPIDWVSVYEEEQRKIREIAQNN